MNTGQQQEQQLTNQNLHRVNIKSSWTLQP